MLIIIDSPNLRFSLVRVRENAEAVAFYRGEEMEQTAVLSRLNELITRLRDKIRWNFGLNTWLNLYSYSTYLLPSLIIAPRYFAGDVQFGVIGQAGFAFGMVYSGLALLVERFADLTALAAQTHRICQLAEQVEALGLSERCMTSTGTVGVEESEGLLDEENGLAPAYSYEQDSSKIAFQGLKYTTPNTGRTLCQDLDISISAQVKAAAGFGEGP